MNTSEISALRYPGMPVVSAKNTCAICATLALYGPLCTGHTQFLGANLVYVVGDPQTPRGKMGCWRVLFQQHARLAYMSPKLDEYCALWIQQHQSWLDDQRQIVLAKKGY